MTMPIYVPPEQLIKDRAEFARKGVARGRSIVALEYDQGVLMMGENSSGSLRKTGEIYDKIAFAGVGRFNEFEMLRIAGIRYADLKGYAYGRNDVSARGLAAAYSQTVGQIFTHEVKPYEVEVLVAEVDGGDRPAQIFRVQFDGTLHDERNFGSIGGQEEELRSSLSSIYQDEMNLGEALAAAAGAIEGVEERQIDHSDWEAAVLDRTLGRRKFRRVEASEVEAART
ncbi:MAG: proteasome subunit alpha [Acidimicrobiia bacterium]|nr:proteasome subunit alpha [Acidimicrobiia bacterium]NNC75282.1 proteasome subunit alpha [Acidimicrobiia bacterium]